LVCRKHGYADRPCRPGAAHPPEHAAVPGSPVQADQRPLPHLSRVPGRAL